MTDRGDVNILGPSRWLLLPVLMNQWLTMLSALIPVFGVIVVGVMVRRLNWLTEEADSTLVKLTVRLLFPCFVLTQMNTNPWPGGGTGIVLPPLVGFLLTAMGFVVAWGAARLWGPILGLVTPAHQRTFVLCVGMFNYGYIPIPLMRELFPAQGPELPTLLLHNVGVDVAMWTLGLLILSGKMGKRGWLGILNPVMIAILLSIGLRFSGMWEWLTIHALPVTRIMEMIGQCAIPLSLLLSGATIADVWRDANFREGWGVIGSGLLIRLGVLPVLFLVIAWGLPFETALERVIVVQASMPAAIFPIILARHYGGDAPTAVRIVITTHLFCLLTCPIWLAVGF